MWLLYNNSLMSFFHPSIGKFDTTERFEGNMYREEGLDRGNMEVYEKYGVL